MHEVGGSNDDHRCDALWVKDGKLRTTLEDVSGTAVHDYKNAHHSGINQIGLSPSIDGQI